MNHAAKENRWVQAKEPFEGHVNDPFDEAFKVPFEGHIALSEKKGLIKD